MDTAGAQQKITSIIILALKKKTVTSCVHNKHSNILNAHHVLNDPLARLDW